MAKYKKKRVRELQHDRFRDTTIGFFDRLGNALEGKGKTILYGLAGVVVLALIVGFWLRWSHRKDDEARRAMGRAITIATTPVAPPIPNPNRDPSAPSFSSERERAQKAAEEFQKVAAKYGEPYHTEARYFAATNLLSIDRTRAVTDLADISKNGKGDVATLAKFALAQAKEADNSNDEAAQLYKDLASQNSVVITPDTANLQLALVYEKLSKKKEAADLLFNIVEASRTAKDAEGNTPPQSAAAREASKELQRMDSARYAQLTPEAPRSGLPF